MHQKSLSVFDEIINIIHLIHHKTLTFAITIPLHEKLLISVENSINKGRIGDFNYFKFSTTRPYIGIYFYFDKFTKYLALENFKVSIKVL